MSDIAKSINGRNIAAVSPFRSISFIVVSTLGLVAVVIDAYLIYRHWHTAPVYVAPILSLAIGLQLIYQWMRMLRYHAKMRKLYSKGPDEELKVGSTFDVAAQVGAGEVMDLLFYSYGITLAALILIGALLTRLDGLR